MGKTITFENLKRFAKRAAVYKDTPSYYEPHIRILKEGVTFWLSNDELLSIKAGFEWDEVSVPYGLQWAFPKSGKYAYSALVHDAFITQPIIRKSLQMMSSESGWLQLEILTKGKAIYDGCL